ncbi:putative DHD superfamily phosphohydrolase [Halovivax ruber XH-70]|uniref:Putative DHD superfamily phosphohydrolase n=1 Tax=Halovivax ruber (strain DSM 18193 / JCM 13892 / XH-70) TaxID=797302 RepID=L0I6N4_HALRX|nr:DHD superfamily phosphohydrolase [Halovivax ruber]AGB15205.1 putative DHD superfamily phosphohydrolase [Halovivax ruber XH-70]
MDDLFDTTDLDPARRSLLPGAGFFLPDDLEADLESDRIEAAVADAECVVVADPDADGLACVALIREAYDDVLKLPELDARDDESDAESDGETDDADGSAGAVETSASDASAETSDHDTPAEAIDSDAPSEAIDAPEPGPHDVVLVPASPHDVEDALGRVAGAARSGVDLFVCDLAPDRYEYVADELEAAVNVADSVRWYDHHQWDDDVAAAVRDAGADLVVGDSDEECSADVVARSLETTFDDRLTDLVAVTRDHDLWIREDSRSDDLADYAYWTDPEEYVEVVRKHGADLPEWVREFLAERRVEKERLIEYAVDRAEFHAVGPYTVGVTYGRCSQNEVAEALREQGADAAVVVKPAGSASIRGTDTFDRCHEVADRVNGGGHPKAAGCKPDIYDDMLDYANHWTTRGAVTKRVILRAFEAVVETDRPDEE